jgi:hypothetical protein
MLKIGSIRWRGKCSRHPGFDPWIDGRGAIRGGCTRCAQLADISETHQRLVSMMRTFAPPSDRPRRNAPKDDSHLQASLFGELEPQR